MNNYKLFYINLERSKDRKIIMEEQLKNQSLIANRYDAVDGLNLDVEFLKYKSSPRTFYYLKTNNRKRLVHEDLSCNGSFACFLSHVKLWEKLINDESCDYYVIMEDDLILYDNFIDRLQNIMKKKPSFDLISLIYNGRRNNDIVVDNMYLIRNPFFGTQCYIISKNCAEKMLKNIDKIDCQIDAYIGYVSFYENLESYLVMEEDRLGKTEFKIRNIDHTHCVFCKGDYTDELKLNSASEKKMENLNQINFIASIVNVFLFIILVFLIVYLIIKFFK